MLHSLFFKEKNSVSEEGDLFSDRKDKSWMNQLDAVVCLSLASNVDEIHTHLLLDLQVRILIKICIQIQDYNEIEHLVLSSLQWKMNPITPRVIFDYTMMRLSLITHLLHSEFMNRSERLLCLDEDNLLEKG
uniref:Cyclin N-terminal domain-containing protein n=1 Tax=Lactuca sativa TaxID=4236 RepID=A0A9R1W8B0_LACSA|nr:hypothetical protein LSAT_V11C200098850 [Lactuca sativa]